VYVKRLAFCLNSAFYRGVSENIVKSALLATWTRDYIECN